MSFVATHILQHNGVRSELMVVDATLFGSDASFDHREYALFTQEEWSSHARADYALVGPLLELRFQGTYPVGDWELTEIVEPSPSP